MEARNVFTVVAEKNLEANVLRKTKVEVSVSKEVKRMLKNG
jgi:hypothetical protein